MLGHGRSPPPLSVVLVISVRAPREARTAWSRRRDVEVDVLLEQGRAALVVDPRRQAGRRAGPGGPTAPVSLPPWPASIATYGIAPAAEPAPRRVTPAASSAASPVRWRRMAAPWSCGRQRPRGAGSYPALPAGHAQRAPRPHACGFRRLAADLRPSPLPTPRPGSRVADHGPSHLALGHRRPAPEPADRRLPLAPGHPAPDLADDLGHRRLLRGHRELVRHPVRRDDSAGPARLHRAIPALRHPRERLPLLPGRSRTPASWATGPTTPTSRSPRRRRRTAGSPASG